MIKSSQEKGSRTDIDFLNAKRLPLNPRKGFSLFELIIYVAIFGGIALFISNFLVTIVGSRGSTSAKFEVNQNLRFSSERIRQLVYDASSFAVSGSCPANALEVTIGTATTTVSLISGALYETGATSSAPLTAASVTATSTDGSTCLFTRIENPSPAKPALQFQYKIGYNDNGNPQLRYSDAVRTSITQRQ